MYAITDIAALACLIGLIAAAVNLEWAVCRTANFAIADTAILGLAFAEWVTPGTPANLMVAIVIASVLRLCLYEFAFLPSVETHQGENSRIAISLGASLFLVALNGLLFGTEPVSRGMVMQGEEWAVLGNRFDAARIEVILTGVALAALCSLWVRYSTLGAAVSLFSSNLRLAAKSGLRSQRVARMVILWSNLLAFGAVRILASRQPIAPHDGGLLMAFGISVAFLGRGRIQQTAGMSLLFALLAYVAGELWQVDLGRAWGLLAASLLILLVDKRLPFQEKRET